MINTYLRKTTEITGLQQHTEPKTQLKCVITFIDGEGLIPDVTRAGKLRCGSGQSLAHILRLVLRLVQVCPLSQNTGPHVARVCE